MSSLDDVVGRTVGHAGDVVVDRSWEQLDVLRQVSDVVTKLTTIQRTDLRAVEPYGTGLWPNQSNDQPRQGRLSGR